MVSKRLDSPVVWVTHLGLLMTALVGCGEPATPTAPQGWYVGHPTDPNAYGVAAGDTAVLRGPNQEEFSLRVESDQPIYAPGATARLSVTLTNLGTSPIALTFGNPRYFGLVLVDAAGAERWQEWLNRPWLAVVTKLDLAPGQSEAWLAECVMPSDVGDYVFVADLADSVWGAGPVVPVITRLPVAVTPPHP